MAKYTKSHSNYTLKSRHQLTSDGIVYERDMSTIGGKETSAPGQIPIYRSGNFVITVNGDDQKTHKVQTTSGWEQNTNNSDKWTINTIVDNSLETTYTPTEVKIKRNFYDLRDFAYYGSCSELIRGSINHINKTYPGELYLQAESFTHITVTYDGGDSLGTITETFNSREEYEKVYPNGAPGAQIITGVEGIPVYYTVGGQTYQITESGKLLYAIDNPFSLNLLDEYTAPSDDENQYKYLRYGNTIDAYSLIKSNGEEKNISISVDWTRGSDAVYCPGEKIATISIAPSSKSYRFSVEQEGQTINVDQSGGTVPLNVTSSELVEESETGLTIYAYSLGGTNVAYMVDFNDSTTSSFFGCHIRPKSDYYYYYMSTLSEFERLLINPDIEPQRTIYLNLLGENEFGYYTYNRSFTYPTTYGGYNLSVDGPTNSAYLTSLSEIAEFYDERFSDNIWRSMTHEGIKNLDWSREKNVGDEYVEPFGRVEKTIRVTGRFFDDIKAYTESLKTINRVTYDDTSNLPEYFFTDKLNEFGWNVVQSIPYIVDLYSEDGNQRIDASQAWTDNTIITPYNSNAATSVFNGCFNNSWSTIDAGDKDTIIDDSGNIIMATKQLKSIVSYTMPDIHNEFVRRLIINSKDILRHKGTLAGIDMLLGMFGMSNKTNTKEGKWYDYEISEYIVKANDVIVDTYDESINSFRYEYLNTFKNIPYDSKEYANGTPIPYYGLPVTFDEFGTKRYLYPNFDSHTKYDGNPYYQMKGGWMKKTPVTFDVNDNVVYVGNEDVYDETVKEIRKVKDIRELIDISYYDVEDGDVVIVNDVSGHYAIVDGVVYDLYTEEIGGSVYTFFIVTVNGNSVIVGNTYFENIITVSNPFYPNNKNKCILEDNIMNGRDIRIYLLSDGGNNYIQAYTNVNSITSFVEYNGQERIDSGYTNYFKINNAYSAGEISPNGWVQLLPTDHEYLVINTMRNENKGNNPHTGKNGYDNGADYLRMYNKLFKYVIDNDLFRERVYSIELPDTSIDTFGFEIDGIDASDYCNNEYSVIKDDKILIACDTFDAHGNESTGDNKIVDATGDQALLFKGLAEHKSNLLINTKRMDITFRILSSGNNFNEFELEQVKYIEGVVLPYLTQMIPSSTICEIKYELCS